jgi:alpha-1,2-mannosyltransferase
MFLTMTHSHHGDEHSQAAGLIPLAHNSGGPRADIVQEGETGFLASDPDQYAQALSRLFAPGSTVEAERVAMRARARKAAGRFSDEVFLEGFGALMRAFLGLEEGKGEEEKKGARRSRAKKAR